MTSARPIIRADAVDAVRFGLRIVFSRANAPAAPPMRVAGHAKTEASGRTSRDAFAETPKKSSRTPTPRADSRFTVVRPCASTPYPSRSTPRTRVTAERIGVQRASRPGGSSTPSAIGGTRVARKAGRKLANSVMSVPTRRHTTIVRAWKTVAALGRSNPVAAKTALSPFASRSPRKRPASEPRIPITSASTTTDRRIWRRVAPIVRSVANSRTRCATVIDSVLAITKLPTNSEIPANARRNP